MSDESRTVARVLREHARTRPDHPLLICEDERLDYASAQRLSGRLARGMIALGVGKGTHIGLLYPDGVDFVVGALAAARIGAVVVPFSTVATTVELRERLIDADIRILLAADTYRSHDYVRQLTEVVTELGFAAGDRLLCATVPQLRHIAISYRTGTRDRVRDIADLDHLADSVDEALLTASEDDVAPADTLAVVYTYGSTGAPKGAVHTHGALLDHQASLNDIRGVSETDVLVRDSPFHSIGGFASGLLATLMAGATLHCSTAVDTGGASLDPLGITFDPQSALPDRPGSTEAGGVVLLGGDGTDRPEHRRGSFGRPAPGFGVRVVDPTTGDEVAVGGSGELCIRGPYVMQSYYKRGREECFDADGWFHTGDLVRVDDEGLVHGPGQRGSRIENQDSPRRGEQARTGITDSRAREISDSDTTRRRMLSMAQAPEQDREAAAVVARTVDELVRSRAVANAAQPAVIDPTAHLTYAELDITTEHLAAAFIEAGIAAGTRVGLVMPNGIGWVRIAIALTRIGAVLVPLSTLLKTPELIAQLRVAAVQTLIATEEFRGHRYADGLRAALALPDDDATILHPELPALRRIWTVEHTARLPVTPEAAAVARTSAATVTAADPLTIMFTSGSRGLPKGVIHSHGNAFGAVRSGLAGRCIDGDTRLYLPMPFFWVGGFGGGVLSALLAGATLVTEEIPGPETTLRLLERERVTLFRGWPDQAEALARQADSIDADLSALRPGSLDALLSANHRARPGARANLFGMTESFGPYSGYPADTDMPESAFGSCGKPFDGMQVRIADPADGTPAPTGSIGEILLRGPHMLRGMCGRSREDLLTEDGFYRTGDLGRLDEAGFLFYHGRSDDMFKVSGATVYPSEVEKALRGVTGVENAFVTSVDAGRGDQVAAAVVCDRAATAARIRAGARDLLSAFKIPTIWLLLESDESIPRGSTGKVDINGLRDLLSRKGYAADELRSEPTP
ncbi:AMP-binding protein [Nocardia aurea]|uniref:AMP-binding protein n=1 Tax=Nocardia aurea TaxID=2144174 RepID=UPI003F4C8538